ncbi:MAG TPA: pyridoxal phosphate-dependent aminotransferase [Vicinamibacteria bacterium]|nr:pyridoxal phosphate-dependent aminotransferase [Vicinamibacteria bacterium]
MRLPMFSERTRWDLRPNRLAERLAAKRRAGARILDLTASNPTQVGLRYPDDLLLPLAGPKALLYEPAPFGLPAARAAVAADFARRGFAVPAERILLSTSTSEAYSFLFKLLCDPGDEVLVPSPGYPLFEFLAALESVEVRTYPLAHDGEWHLDVAALRAAAGPRTRAVVAVSPGNPTGAFLKLDERAALEALCAERSMALVSDEVFADFAFRDDPRRAASVARDGEALAFALGGLSKSCGLPQLKLAWTAVTGPAALRRDALARLEVVADTYLSVSTPVQAAAPALLARRDELQAPIRERVLANLGALRRALGPGSPATLLEPEGGWYAVLRIPATRSEEERVTRLLDGRDVLVHPGYFFDFPGEAYLVLSLLPPVAEFAEGVAGVVADLVL